MSDQPTLPFLRVSDLLVSLLVGTCEAAERQAARRSEPDPAGAQYAGLWTSDDGYVRHRLLPDGRYVEARGTREQAYSGRYLLRGNHIDYLDDRGFVEDGEFHGDELHHAGLVLYRQPAC